MGPEIPKVYVLITPVRVVAELHAVVAVIAPEQRAINVFTPRLGAVLED